MTEEQAETLPVELVANYLLADLKRVSDTLLIMARRDPCTEIPEAMSSLTQARLLLKARYPLVPIGR